jgi:hypothetical protein
VVVAYESNNDTGLVKPVSYPALGGVVGGWARPLLGDRETVHADVVRVE